MELVVIPPPAVTVAQAIRRFLDAQLTPKLRIQDALDTLMMKFEDIDFSDRTALTYPAALRLVEDVGLEVCHYHSQEGGGFLRISKPVLFSYRFPELADVVDMLIACDGARTTGRPGKLPPRPTLRVIK